MIYSRELTPTEVFANYVGISGNTAKLPTVGKTIGYIGDSILASPAAQAAQVTNTMPFPFHASMLLNSPSLNKAVSGDTTTQMVARFATDITANMPYVLIIEGGTNDAAATTAVGTVTANYTTMVNAAIAAGIKNIFVMLVTPATSKDNTQMTLIDTYNAAIAALPNVTAVINCNPSVGQFRSGGTAGNLWDWQSAYNADGLHPTEAGARALAVCVANAVIAAGLTVNQEAIYA
jgi:lysophospholipase L1-like esterase